MGDVLGPHFLVIGAQKAGTTTLYEHLRSHPGLFLPDNKEPHFFCSPSAGSLPAWEPRLLGSLRDVLVADLDEYRSLFRGAGTRRTGECSTGYLADPDAAARAVVANPAVRVIAVLRDPVERAYSAWWMYHRSHHDRLSFEEALEAEPSRLADGWGHPFAYRGNGQYSHHLARWRSVLHPDQMLVLRFEDLVNNTGTTLATVCDFLGVERLRGELPHIAANAARPRGGSVRGHALAARLAPFRPTLSRVIPSRLLARATSRVLPPTSVPTIDAQIDAMLRASLTADIEELERDLGWDLSNWKCSA